MKSKEKRRCRCAVCHQHFLAHPSAVGSQKVCSKACRLKHRRKLAQQRRQESLDEHRRDERMRQKASRARRRDQGKTQEGSSLPAMMSRTTLNVQLSDIIDEFMNFVDSESGMSRTTLREAKEKFIQNFDEMEVRITPKVGQKGPSNSRCHEPP